MNENQMVIKGARLAFADLWVPAEYEPGDGKPRYSATLLIPKDSPQLAQIEALGLRMFIDTFKEKEGKIHWAAVKANPKNSCLSDGNLKVYDGFAGNMALTAHRQVTGGKPKIIDKDAVTELMPVDGKPYNGCYVNAKLLFWVQDNKHGKALRATLEVVQFAKDGDAFSGAAPASTEGMEPEEEETLV